MLGIAHPGAAQGRGSLGRGFGSLVLSFENVRDSFGYLGQHLSNLNNVSRGAHRRREPSLSQALTNVSESEGAHQQGQSRHGGASQPILSIPHCLTGAKLQAPNLRAAAGHIQAGEGGPRAKIEPAGDAGQACAHQEQVSAPGQN